MEVKEMPLGSVPPEVEPAQPVDEPSLDDNFDTLFGEEPVKPPSPEAEPEAIETPEKPEAAEEEPKSKEVPDDDDDLAGLINEDKKDEEPDKEEPDKEEPKPEEPKPEEPNTPKELRKVYESTKTELKSEQAKAAELETKVQELESKLQSEVDAKVQEALASEAEHKAKLEEKVKFLDYKSSEDYKQKYLNPLRKAWGAAFDSLDGVETVNEDGDVRKATHKDFMSIVQLPTGQAGAKARELFGDAAPDAMAHRRKILDLDNAQNEAVEEWKTKGEEFRARADKEAQTERARTVKLFDSTLADRRKQYADLFADDSDKDGNAYLEKGMKLVNLALKGEGLEEGLTPRERTEVITKAQADVALRAAAFGRERFRTNALREEVKGLKAKLDAYEKTEPTSKDEGSAKSHSKKASSWEESLDSMPSTYV